MPALGFVVPLLPGKTETDRSAMRSCWQGDRKSAYESSRERLGITREAVWIQQTPAGDVAVVYLEADDLEAAGKGMATSEEPFDRWFRTSVTCTASPSRKGSRPQSRSSTSGSAERSGDCRTTVVVDAPASTLDRREEHELALDRATEIVVAPTAFGWLQ